MPLSAFRIRPVVSADVSDKKNLKSVMGFIRDCKRRHQQTTELMEPVNAVMGILRRHHAISEGDMEHLEEMRKDAPQACRRGGVLQCLGRPPRLHPLLAPQSTPLHAEQCRTPPPPGCIGRREGTPPPPLQGAQPMPSHVLPDAKWQPQWHM